MDIVQNYGNYVTKSVFEIKSLSSSYTDCYIMAKMAF
jgi:hypothetical protein